MHAISNRTLRDLYGMRSYRKSHLAVKLVIVALLLGWSLSMPGTT